MRVLESFNKNNFIIEDDDKLIFQSYSSLICEIDFLNKVIKISNL